MKADALALKRKRLADILAAQGRDRARLEPDIARLPESQLDSLLEWHEPSQPKYAW